MLKNFGKDSEVSYKTQGGNLTVLGRCQATTHNLKIQILLNNQKSLT